MGVYRDHARAYLDAGWTCVLPVPIDAKFPPPAGYTGYDGANTSPEQVDAWRDSHASHAVALRMPPGVIGIDVDHYDKTSGTGKVVTKRGGDTLAEYEAKWGTLPPTWRSSARELPSGIRLYRVPAGTVCATVLGDAIEIIQHHHRYAVVAPSPHPAGTYAWISSAGDRGSVVPRPDELPELPPRWVAGLTEQVNQTRTAPAAKGEAAKLLAAIEADDRPACAMVERAQNRAVTTITGAGGGSRHDTAMARTMRLVTLAAEGHTGVAGALDAVREAWEEATAGEGRDYELASLIDGAAAQAAGITGSGVPRPLDPCEGASGQGVVVMGDPGEGRRRQVLIVEGLDDARACAEYAQAGVLVLGMAGRESWRRDGIPVPELKVVAELACVLVFGPDVWQELDTYNTAMALKEACLARGAAVVGFVQPAGASGVRMGSYLGALEEPEREPTLTWMLDSPTAKPAPDKSALSKRSVLGAADTEELPPTDDTFLGTTWADQHLSAYRVVSTDKAWMGYRDGRWSVDGAELDVGHSLMEFLSETSQPLQAAKAREGDPDERKKIGHAVDAILSTRKRQAVASSAMHYRPMHVRRDELDQHPKLWCAANGILDLATLEVRPHEPGLMLTTGSDVAYDPEARCPAFDRFLTEVLPDEQVRAFVLRVFAMAMYGEVVDQILPVFIGTGRNGKGVLIKIMLAVFGSHARVINAKALLKRKYDAHEQEIAQLAGKRLAVAEETGQSSEWDVARVNEWTGGGRLSGRFMQGNSFDFEPSHTLLMVTNHRPNVGQGETAFWERYKEVPFTQSFEGSKGDPKLAARIIEGELSGVFNRLIEAGVDYRAHGLAEPTAVTMATADAKVDSDNLFRFVTEHIAVTNDHELDRVYNTELYDTLLKWWSQNVRGETPPVARMFPKQMRPALGFPADANNPRKLGAGRDNKRVWTGIRWLDGGSPDPANRPLTPLTQTREPERVLRQSVPETSPKADDDQGDPKKSSDANAPSTDAKTDAIVDQATPVSAGQDFTTDGTDATDAKGRVRELYEEKGQSDGQLDQLVENSPIPRYMESTNRRLRQLPFCVSPDPETAAAPAPEEVLPGQTGGRPTGLDKGDRIASRYNSQADHPETTPDAIKPAKPAKRAAKTAEEKAEGKARRKIEEQARKAAEIEAAVREAEGERYSLPVVVGRAGTVHAVSVENAVTLTRQAFERAGGALTVDVETSGYPVGHRHYELRSVQLGDEVWALVFHPVDHAEAIRGLLAEADVLHAHAANADLIPLAMAGLIDIESGWDRMHDTVIPAKLADPQSTGSDPGLKKLAPAVLGPKAVVAAADEGRLAVFTAGKWLTRVKPDTPPERSGWARIETRSKAMLVYAASDVLDTAALATSLPPVTPEVRERERLVQRMTARVTHRGFCIDYDRVQALTAEHEQLREVAGTQVRAYGIENPGSGQQVARVLADMRVDLPMSEKGNLSVAEHVLATLVRVQPDTEPGKLAQAVLDYRHSNTVIGLFLAPYRQLCELGDGRARPTVYTLGTDTGRMSCVRPNAQQLSREGGVRSIYLADPGHVFISADFSGVELRGAAALSQDTSMMHMIKEEDAGRFDGFHWEVARQAFGPGATKADRYIAKRGVFGTFYGGGVTTLSRQVGVPEDEMGAIVSSLKAIAPGFFQWAEQTRQAVRKGHTRFETYSGRVVHFPQEFPHKAPNYAIQGSCRELLIDALVRWRDTRWGDCTLLPVHDELIMQVPAEDAHEATLSLVECMRGELLGVKIIADAGKPDAETGCFTGSPFWEDAT